MSTLSAGIHRCCYAKFVVCCTLGLLILGLATKANAQTLRMPEDSGAWQNLSDREAGPEIAQVGYTETSPAAINTSSADQVSKESLGKELAELDGNGELSDEQREEIKARLQTAIGWLDKAESSRQRHAELESLLPKIPDQVSDARQALSEFSESEFEAMPTGQTIAELEAQLAALRQQLDADEKAFKDRESEIENRTSLTTSRAKEIVDLEEKIPKLRAQIESITATDVATQSQLRELRARLLLREQELATGKLERRRLEEVTELLPLQRDLAKRVWTNRQKMMQRWQTAIDNWRKEESRRQADAARKVAENAHPALKSLAEDNAHIAEQRLATAAEIQRLTALIKRLNAQREQLSEDFKDLSGRVEHAGTTSTTGLLLRKKRSELPSDRFFLDHASAVKSTMPTAHLTLMQWKRQRLEVADTAETATTIMKSLQGALGNADPKQVQEVVVRLLEDRRTLLDKAIPDQDTYLQDLNELELANQKLQEQVTEFRHYLNQRVLWIRSTNVIALDDLEEAMSGLQLIFQPQRWQESMRVGGVAMLRRPAVGFAMLALLALLILFRARLHKTQADLLDVGFDDGKTIRFRRYFSAFLLHCLLSIRWPALLLAIGYRLRLSAQPDSWTQSVGDALITSVVFLWGCELIRELCRKDCVGERAFGWPAAATAKVRSTLELTALIGTPMFALLQLTQFGELDGMQSLQRLLFIGVLSLFVVQLGWLTRPAGGLMKTLAESSAQSVIYRSRHAIWFVVTTAPLALAILSVAGYHFSAYQLSGRLVEMGAVLVGMILLYSLALCWLNTISFNRALHNQTEQATQLNLSGGDAVEAELDAGTVDHTPEYDPQAFYRAADQEVRDMLRYACWIVMIVGGWFIWSDVLPALRMFDHVVLWQSIESVAETVVDGNGNESLQFVDHSVSTTLTDLLVAFLIVIGTLMIGRRLPGVLQLVFLEHLPIQPGGRQAIAILTRYAATVVGLLFACSVIRLSWSSVQWLAAAMTVGLGFGLQEIFANLVSGLIILVERPVRVGDTVTVGDVTGTITRMQMRATTVTDYDRRELIVPNKKFITDNVINWTLSDPISRVVLPVGVAYGTDIARVREILLEIAQRCPFVLDEPAPNTLFKGFGDSTLNVQLMVFIPQRSVYIDVVNELNAAIAVEFDKANIDIAFPQLDLHVKHMENALEPSVNKTIRPAAA